MSLQAKIEAVIYASEEPVTLSQLVGLLGVEAQAELDAAEAQQGSLLLMDDAGSAENAAESAAEQPTAEHSPAAEPDASPAETLEGASETGRESTPGHATLAGQALFSGEAISTSADEPEAEQRPGEPVSANTGEPAAPEDDKRQARERERRLREYFRAILDRLIAEYAGENRGLEIREVAGGFRFATKPEYHDTVRGFVRSLKPPLKLSLQALETLAVVAYKQPVTVPEVSEIRGVDSGGVLGSLIARKLVTTAGRKQVIGRPILYKTTKEFLLRFGLKDINELPSIEEFERMASELTEAVQEEMEMEQAQADPNARHAEEAAEARALAADVEPMRDVHEAQPDGTPDGPPDSGAAGAGESVNAQGDQDDTSGTNSSEE